MISRGQGFSYPFLLHYWFHLVFNKKLKNNIRNRILLNAKGLILKANGLNSNMLSTTFQSETCLPFSTKKWKETHLDRLLFFFLWSYYNIGIVRNCRLFEMPHSVAHSPRAPMQRQFSENICSKDDLRSRIFGTFFVKFLACLPLLGFSDI